MWVKGLDEVMNSIKKWQLQKMLQNKLQEDLRYDMLNDYMALGCI